MKTRSRTKEKASALIITLLVIFLIVASIGIAMQLTTATVRQTDSSRDFSALRSAAEGALDFAYGVWAKTHEYLLFPGDEWPPRHRHGNPSFIQRIFPCACRGKRSLANKPARRLRNAFGQSEFFG